MKKRGIFFGALLIGSITQTMVDLIVLTKWDIIEIYFVSVMVGILITAGVAALVDDKPKKKSRRKQVKETRLPVIREGVLYEVRREHEA